MPPATGSVCHGCSNTCSIRDVAGPAHRTVFVRLYTPRVTRQLLAVDHALPAPDRDSGSACTFSHLQILRGAGYEITFLAPRTSPDDPYAHALARLGVMVPRVDDVEDLRATVARLAPACDVVLLYRAPVADLVIDLVREVAPSTQVVFLPVDLHHVRMAREAALSGADPRAAEHMRTLELDLVGRSNAVVVVSEVEHDLLRAAVPGARVTT